MSHLMCAWQQMLDNRSKDLTSHCYLRYRGTRFSSKSNSLL